MTAERRARARAYGLLLSGAIGAGLLGAVFDELTVSLSPEYFTLGKGLSPEGLRAEVAWMGFRAALPLGALGVGVGLLRSQKDPELPWGAWLRRIVCAFMASLLVAAALMAVIDPFGVRAASRGVLSPLGATRYLLAWGLHVGAYLGVGVGVAIAGRAPRRDPGR